MVLPVKAIYAQNCDTVFEMIAELRDPPIGAYNIWDTLYGDINTKEVFKGVVKAISSRNVVAVGEVFKNNFDRKVFLITEIDRRGRPVWEKNLDIEGLVNIEKIIAHQKNYIVLVNIKNKAGQENLWLGFFDEKGELLTKHVIDRGKSDLQGTTITVSKDRQDLIITAFLKPPELSSPASTILFWMSLKSKRIIRDRVFAFGTENKIHAIKPMEYENGYWASGYIRTQDGRMAGWILKLNYDGGLIWQRQFARGIGGRFFDVAEFLDGQFVVAAGEAYAADDTRQRSAWVALLEGSGEDLAWQRYYRGDHAMRAQSVLIHDDGQISVLIDAKESQIEDDKDYVRLITLNPRGVILKNLTFHNAEGAGAYGMTSGYNRERIFYGYSDVKFDVEKENQDNAGEYLNEIVKSRQGWLIAADAAETYEDPCRKDFSFIP